MSRLISDKSSCVKKLFLYEFLLSMLSYMNYLCIHSDNCLLSWAQILQCLHKAEVLQGHHCVVFTRVNSCCLLWLSSFRLSALVVLTMLFTVAEHMNIFSFCLSLSFNFSFTWHQHQLNCLTVTISLCCFCFKTHITMPIKARPLSWLLWVSYAFFVCDTDTGFRIVLTVVLVTVKNTLLHLVCLSLQWNVLVLSLLHHCLCHLK